MRHTRFQNFRLLLILLPVFCLALVPLSAQVYDVRLSGAQQVPPNESVATGRCLAVFDPDSSVLGMVCSHNVAGAEAAQIHVAVADAIGDPVLSFESAFSPMKGVFTLAADEVEALQAGLLYVNIQSEGYPEGEIGGRIGPPADLAVSFRLSGDNEVPPVVTENSGVCAAVLTPLQDNLAVACGHDAGGVLAAAVHRGAPGATGPVVFGLGASTTLMAEVTPMDVDDFGGVLADLLAGNLYVNVRTQAFPDGELRAQIPGPGVALYFPQFGNGDGFTSSIVLTNTSTTTEAEGVLAFYDGEGMPLPVMLGGVGGVIAPAPPVSEVPFVIPPLGATTVATSGQGALTVGSAEVISNVPVGGVVRFYTPGIGIAGFGSSAPMVRAIAPVRQEGDIRTAIAIRNNETYPIQVVLTLLGEDGQPPEFLGADENAVELTIPANGQVPRFMDEHFPQLAGETFLGTVVIEAVEGSFSAIALEMGSDPGEYTSLPVSPVLVP